MKKEIQSRLINLNEKLTNKINNYLNELDDIKDEIKREQKRSDIILFCNLNNQLLEQMWKSNTYLNEKNYEFDLEKIEKK